MSGPYETERQAADAARHIYDSPPGAGAWGAGNLRLLEDACRAAGVRVGTYDYQILLWLTSWEPATCAVIAGLITRAHAAGQGEARQLAERAAGQAACADCPERDRTPVNCSPDCNPGCNFRLLVTPWCCTR